MDLQLNGIIVIDVLYLPPVVIIGIGTCAYIFFFKYKYYC